MSVKMCDDIDPDSREFAKLADGNCPDCNHRGFVLGPAGGASRNIECGNFDCRARFNVVVYGWELVSAQRIPSGHNKN